MSDAEDQTVLDPPDGRDPRAGEVTAAGPDAAAVGPEHAHPLRALGAMSGEALGLEVDRARLR